MAVVDHHDYRKTSASGPQVLVIFNPTAGGGEAQAGNGAAPLEQAGCAVNRAPDRGGVS